MKYFVKQILDLIASSYPITNNLEVDNTLYIIIGVFSFLIAFGIVGMIFDALRFYDSDIMRSANGFFRVFIFLTLSWVFRKIFIFISWIGSFKWWVYFLAILLITLIIYMRKYIKNKNVMLNKLVDNIETEKEMSSVDHKLEIVDTSFSNRYLCPQCGLPLIKRQGPYGEFWGCTGYQSNDRKNSCRYTRKYY